MHQDLMNTVVWQAVAKERLARLDLALSLGKRAVVVGERLKRERDAARALLRRAVAHHTNDTKTPMWVTEARQLLGEIDNAADAAGGQDE